MPPPPPPPPPQPANWWPWHPAGHGMAEGNLAAAAPQATMVPPRPDAGKQVTVEVRRSSDSERILVT
eukprot:730755-Alexandrium_andersonii.AAC.1